ncbi:chorion peroxidase isoform X1 [Pieris rapae]|uniref:chorion peroxidase isoform X1 n=1 Tax=Pieris rapae TaxID=64459 RepID=UPI001E27FB8B|nr:chorion peroxidase isoform X1 [Pieris rapae]
MKKLSASQILLSVIFCPLFVITHEEVFGGHYGIPKQEHKHPIEPPCAVCPRNGVCVPKIQCPAHVRPGAYNPRCHLDKQHIGICCFTGYSHAAEFELIPEISKDDIKAVHNISKQRLDNWIKRADLAKINIDKSQEYIHHHVATNKETNDLGHGGLMNVFAAQELRTRLDITEEDLALAFTRNIDGPFCPLPPTCPAVPSKYRRVDGNCNNKQQPSWGAALTGYERILPPDYRDGIWAFRLSITGSPLPSARDVSSSLLVDRSHPSRSHNLLFMQFGQFLAHDVSAGVLFSTANGSALSCCLADGTHLPIEHQHWACEGIDVSPKDTFYGQFNKRCMNFVRTQLAPSADCSVGYAKQMNGATHYIDLSPLYGSSLKKLQELRVAGGRLKSFHDFGRTLPPLTDRKECLIEKHGAACFDSGDNRGNQIISLTAMHTLFLREHNRIARALSLINSEWDDERIFNEARRIVQAEFQNIVYYEWLPLLLGPKIMRLFKLSSPKGYSSGYNPSINPSTTAEFAAAAMRFGHSTVDNNIMIPQSGDVVETLPISEVMYQPSRMRFKPFLDRILIGMSWQPMQNVDPLISSSLSKYLFHGGHPHGLDLAAINIQRGRDYGLRSYNDYRKLIGLEPIEFTQYSLNVAKRLAIVYHSPQDIDLWIGGLLEKPIDGGLVGPTFAQILADQFTRFKRGDRYFFDYGPDVNPGAFTIGQLLEIKKVTFARIICDNSDHIELENQAPDAFLRADLPGNEPIRCDSPQIPAIDLRIFKDI